MTPTIPPQQPAQREPMVRALQNYLEEGFQAYGLDVPVSRRLVNWTNCDKQPALFVVQKHERVKSVTQLVTVTVNFDLVLYVKTDADSTKATTEISNPIVDALFSLLGSTPAGERQLIVDVDGIPTAYDLSIEGEIITDEGLLGDQGIVVMPLAIILP